MSEASKIVFMGSDAIGLPVLEWLHRSAAKQAHLVAVLSQPDRPVGRGRKLQPNPISAYAREQGIELLQPEKPGDTTVAWMQAQSIDLAVVMAYGHMLRKKLLDTPPCGFVNLHASILPEYRGASPIQSCIAQGDVQTGVTLMRIEPAMDAGAVCDIERVPIEAQDTGASVFDKLAHASVPLLERNLLSLLEGTATFEEQDHAKATYTRKLTKEDGWLDFSQSAFVLKNRIQSLDPWPGTFCEHAGVRIKVRGAQVEDTCVDKPAGCVLGVQGDALRVATGEGVLRIAYMQRPGGKMLPVHAFLRGYRLVEGDVLSGGDMKSLLRQG